MTSDECWLAAGSARLGAVLAASVTRLGSLELHLRAQPQLAHLRTVRHTSHLQWRTMRWRSIGTPTCRQ
jgi:hypothetical protein